MVQGNEVEAHRGLLIHREGIGLTCILVFAPFSENIA